jgi:hypothetical protein
MSNFDLNDIYKDKYLKYKKKYIDLKYEQEGGGGGITNYNQNTSILFYNSESLPIMKLIIEAYIRVNDYNGVSAKETVSSQIQNYENLNIEVRKILNNNDANILNLLSKKDLTNKQINKKTFDDYIKSTFHIPLDQLNGLVNIYEYKIGNKYIDPITIFNFDEVENMLNCVNNKTIINKILAKTRSNNTHIELLKSIDAFKSIKIKIAKLDTVIPINMGNYPTRVPNIIDNINNPTFMYSNNSDNTNLANDIRINKLKLILNVYMPAYENKFKDTSDEPKQLWNGIEIHKENKVYSKPIKISDIDNNTIKITNVNAYIIVQNINNEKDRYNNGLTFKILHISPESAQEINTKIAQEINTKIDTPDANSDANSDANR